MQLTCERIAIRAARRWLAVGESEGLVPRNDTQPLNETTPQSAIADSSPYTGEPFVKTVEKAGRSLPFLYLLN